MSNHVLLKCSLFFLCRLALFLRKFPIAAMYCRLHSRKACSKCKNIAFLDVVGVKGCQERYMTHTPSNMHSIRAGISIATRKPFLCTIIRQPVVSNLPSGMLLVPGDGSNVSVFDAARRSTCLHGNSYYIVIIQTNTCAHLGACVCVCAYM